MNRQDFSVYPSYNAVTASFCVLTLVSLRFTTNGRTVLSFVQLTTVAQSVQCLGYGIGDRGIGVRFPVGAGDFYLLLL